MHGKKIIDTHTHTWPDKIAETAVSSVAGAGGMTPFSDGTRSALEKSMKEAGISVSVSLQIATKPSQVEVINKTAGEFTDSSVILSGTLHPQKKDFEKDIDYMHKNGIKIIKMHPEHQDFRADSAKMFPVYKELEKSGMILYLHAGKEPGPFPCDRVPPAAILRIQEKFTDLKIVAAHLGGYLSWKESFQYLAGTAVYFDTSAVNGLIDEKLLEKIIEKHGTKRILFGTDSPWASQKSEIKFIKSIGLTAEEENRVFYLNAVKLFGLKKHPFICSKAS